MSFKASKQEYNRRLKICNACKVSKTTYGVGLTCGTFLKPVKGVSCGCKLSWKASIENQNCPQNKWGEKELKNEKEE